MFAALLLERFLHFVTERAVIAHSAGVNGLRHDVNVVRGERKANPYADVALSVVWIIHLKPSTSTIIS